MPGAAGAAGAPRLSRIVGASPFLLERVRILSMIASSVGTEATMVAVVGSPKFAERDAGTAKAGRRAREQREHQPEGGTSCLR